MLKTSRKWYIHRKNSEGIKVKNRKICSLSFSLRLEGEETWWFINRSINIINEDLKRHSRKNNETLRAGPASKLNLARHFWSWYSLLRKQLLSHHQRFTVVELLIPSSAGEEFKPMPQASQKMWVVRLMFIHTWIICVQSFISTILESWVLATFASNTVIIYVCEILAHLKAWRAFKIENHP